MKLYTKNLLQQYNIRPSKRLGQNFLISQKVLQKIIQTAGLSKKDIVLEVGPGLGILTRELAQRTQKVIAVEKDKKMAEALKEILKDYKNIKIIHDDILKSLRPPFGPLRPKDLGLKGPNKIVANIPYYLTSPLVRLFLESAQPPQEIVLLIQKEVAQRICAQPPKMSLLAVAVQFYSQPKIISYVSKKSFWPQPKVDSAIIKIDRIKKPKKIRPEKFFRIVKAGFSSPRKQLANNLSRKLNLDREKIKKALTQCHLDIRVRAETLSVEDWEDWINLYTLMDRRW